MNKAEKDRVIYLDLEPYEYISDLEKHIFIARKAYKSMLESPEIHVFINCCPENDEKIKERTKARLERRFSGVTVYFPEKGEQDAVLYPDG